MPGSLDLPALRAETPGVAARVHLNNAGAALMPAPVLRAVLSHLQLEAEIGGYEAEAARLDAVQAVYGDLAALVGARARNVAVVENATVAVAQALAAFDFRPGDRIVTTSVDYPSNQLMYLSLSRRLGVEVVRAGDLPEGGVDPDSVRRLAGHPRCRLVALSWIPTNSGLVQDAEAVGAVCEELGVPYLVDACQAVGQLPIDLGRLRCDYLAATARKFLRGPRGIGFLYVSDRALDRGDYPLLVDMHGARWLEPTGFRLADGARRFENWEFAYALVLGMGAAARYALEVGVEAACQRAWGLAERLRAGLAEVDGVTLLDRGAVRCAIVTVHVRGREGPDLVRALRERGINTSGFTREAGVIDMDRKGVASGLRLSPHYYNTEDEVDHAVAALAEVVRPG
ncbi:MAG TPA: aminotransferase class V-fold PLP-dependent enzyme [Gemmatimonadales bacterium]|nr:aminotransferase class V-fold PLP-dependent enzyme [Gemmatimonadales bacterium]